MPHSLSLRANRFKGKRITLEISPRPTCRHCGKPMKIEARSYPRMTVGLHENYELVTTYYRCGIFSCPGHNEPTIQPPNPHVGPKLEYDFDVLTKIVEFRWKYALTYDKIVERMEIEYGILINHSAVENTLKLYEIGCAGKYKPEYIAEIKKIGGIILTIDAMKPMNGERALYVARDHRTGITLGSRLLPNQKQAAIEAFLRAVAIRVEDELGVPILGIVSDALPSQRKAIEVVFPSVPHCLCHYHFYNLVLISPKKGDSHLVTQIRKELRDAYDIKKFKESRDMKARYTSENKFLVKIVETLLVLSNWSRKPKDPFFTGLELWKRVNDVASIVTEACSSIGAMIFTKTEENMLQRLDDVLTRIKDEHHELATDLMQVKAWLNELQEILSDETSTADEGLKALQILSNKAQKREKVKGIGKKEKDFCEAFVKFVDTKGDHLFNYKNIEGGPTTNNSHELFYKQLKHLIRKVIGFAAASSYIISHGERIVYVKPGDSPANIREIFVNLDHEAARKIIASERNSRDSLSIIMHDEEKWDKNINELKQILQDLQKR